MASESLVAKLNSSVGDPGKSGKRQNVLRGISSGELRTGPLSKELANGVNRGKQPVVQITSTSSKIPSPASSTHTINSGTAQRVLALAQTIRPDSYVIRRDKNFRRNSSQLWLTSLNHIQMLQAKFNSQDQSSEDGSTPLITKLDKYTHEELTEFRQVFNLFDTDRSGAIGLDEMENAITNLGMDPKQFDMQMLIHEADKRGNNQIDFDEFCEVMKALAQKNQTWNEVVRQCFEIFDRNETGVVTKQDFEFVLRELGGINDTKLLEELFAEFDVDSDGYIDYEEFAFLVKNYLHDDDIV
ncbi:hypothetical protein M3Y97_00072800 [Aphelenchoides bicaudatus]|nr:hypothetical protein M3Y97_00072800 [Aphelenchoides bicaudatus]